MGFLNWLASRFTAHDESTEPTTPMSPANPVVSVIPEDERVEPFQAVLVNTYRGGWCVVERSFPGIPGRPQRIAVFLPIRRELAEKMRQSNAFDRVLIGRVGD